MTVWGAWTEGMRRVSRAPVVLAATWLVTLMFSVPLTLGVRGEVLRQLGPSLEAAPQVANVTYDWLAEYGDQATGVSATLGPSVLGFAAVVDDVSAWLDAESRSLVIVATGAAYALLWTFLAGGIIDRLARGRATRAHAFFQACGGYGFRLLRLTLLAGLVYLMLFSRLHPWLFDTLFDRWTESLDSERTAALIRGAMYLSFGAVLATVNLFFDYAKVRLVVEDRGSAIGALRAAWWHIRRTPGGTVMLYSLDAALAGAVMAAYAGLAPGPASTWLAFIVGQLYIAGRIWVKLVFWATETVWFQGRTAHAGYTARRLPVWPESAAAEALESRYTLLSRPPTEAP